jgi:bifunctional UDP-N-acetylglucosamine pyrophosphorylase/glucosamine-1-phosphate N-acetyltransferase
VILAGGQGKRLGFDGPKVLAEICGAPALGYVLDAAAGLRPEKIVVVACHQKQKVAAFLDARAKTAAPAGRTAAARSRPGTVEWVDQGEPRGTGHAVLATAKQLEKFAGDVLVLFGDGPLVRSATLASLVADHRRRKPACTMAPAQVGDPTGYGRVLRGVDGAFERVVEEKDADAETKRIREVHCGLAVFRAADLFRALRSLRPDNAQREYYLTDVYRLLRESGARVDLWPLPDSEEALGFNTPAELLECRRRMRARILARHQAAGVEIEDPESVHIDHDVEIGPGARILPFVVIRAGVRIGPRCEVGPFSHLRRGTVLEGGAEVGNFVEVKNSRLGAGVKAKHLTYLGDAVIGRETNVGAGTITANFDGKQKHVTTVGARAFIGSGTVLIAPVSVGDEAVTGAGAVVPRGHDVAPGTTVIGVPARPHPKAPPATSAPSARARSKRRKEAKR